MARFRPLLALAVTALLLTMISATAAGAPAQNSAWYAGMTIHNNTRYDLVYESFDGKNVDVWIARPPREIKAGNDSPLIRWANETPNGDTFGTVTYSLYPVGQARTPDLRVGTVQYTVRIDCAWFGCSDYFRKSEARVFPDGVVAPRWTDNGGTPGQGFYGDVTFFNRGLIQAAPWKHCSTSGLGAAYSNLVARDVSCEEARAAILRGQRGEKTGWTCDQGAVESGRTQITCARGDARLRFDLD